MQESLESTQKVSVVTRSARIPSLQLADLPKYERLSKSKSARKPKTRIETIKMCEAPQLSHRSFKSCHALSDRSHPNYILLDDEKMHLYRAMMGSWMKQYRSEDCGFHSTLLYCQIKMTELTLATERQELPCKDRITVACDLFQTLCASPVYKQSLTLFRDELFRAIFVDFDPHFQSVCGDFLVVCAALLYTFFMCFFYAFVEVYFVCCCFCHVKVVYFVFVFVL